MTSPPRSRSAASKSASGKKGAAPPRKGAAKAAGSKVVKSPRSFGGREKTQGARRSTKGPASTPRASAAAALVGVVVHQPGAAPAKAPVQGRGTESSSPMSTAVKATARGVKREALAELFRRKTSDLVDRIVASAPTSLLERAVAEPTDLDTVATGMRAVVAPAAPIGQDERARVAARAAARARGVQYMVSLIERAGGAYTAEELADVLGKEGGRATVAAGRKSDRYFGLPTAFGSFTYPKLQVTADHAVLPGLQTFLRSFTLPDPWTKLTVRLEPSPALGGRAPLEALRAGDVEGASAVARAYGSHGA